MEKEKDAESGKEESCSKCGSCCGGKFVLAMTLLLLGGLIGYALGHCGRRFHRTAVCIVPVSAPATPGK